jgi:hypothetical protein
VIPKDEERVGVLFPGHWWVAMDGTAAHHHHDSYFLVSSLLSPLSANSLAAHSSLIPLP